MGTSRAGSGQLHGQLPKATGVRAVHSRPPPASTAACGVSAPFLGEGMVLAVQSPGPEACTPGGSLAGPHQAWTAQTPRRRPASLHPVPPIPPSIRVFSNESTLHVRWPKYWSLSFSIIPSKEIPGLISFRMDPPA